VAPPVIVKKYGNRRLYDTGDSKYVTLDELAAKIRSGADLRIVDAQTNEDLTQATLTQLVLETGHAAKFLPVQLLTQMIRLSDDSLAEFFSRYVTNALEMYLQAKRGMQAIPGYNTIAQLPMAATDALARMWGMNGPPMGGYGYPQPYPQYPQPAPPGAPINVAPPPPPDEPPAAQPNGDVAAMRHELDELKQMLRDSMTAKKPSPKKPKKPV
jgi:polyhydroxyalkanoate synthesis repressor PhaR